MRQINFIIIFAVCLALVLFSLENTQPASIKIFHGFQVKAPLAIELLLAMWLGAVLAWLFSLWTQLVKQLEFRQNLHKMRSQEERIQELEQNVDSYKTMLEKEKQPLLSSSTSLQEGATTE